MSAAGALRGTLVPDPGWEELAASWAEQEASETDGDTSPDTRARPQGSQWPDLGNIMMNVG